jgi:hypothetical protein
MDEKSSQAETKKDTRLPHIAAWHDADTDEARTAAVKAHPVLLEIYAAAANFKPEN